MKKILQIVPCLELGGTEAFIMNNYRVLDRSQYQFDFMVFREKEYPYLDEIERLGGHVYYSGVPSLRNAWKFVKQFKKIVEEGGPYIAVHSHANIDNALPMWAAFVCKIPIRVSHSHDTSGKNVDFLRQPWYRTKEYLIKKYATSLLGCSEAAGNYLYGEKLFSAKGKVIPNGIDVRKFLDDRKSLVEMEKKEWKISKECPLIVGNITRFEQKKNSLFTIKVFKKILDSVPEAVLIMGGPDGGLLEQCKELADDLNIRDNIRFIGKRRDIPIWLKMIDIYLFPSLYEGLGISILEAQASGCFCAVSDGVATEADQGIESMIYISLKKDEKQWSQEILDQYFLWQRPTNDVIMSKFVESGFEIREAHRSLMEVYDGK